MKRVMKKIPVLAIVFTMVFALFVYYAKPITSVLAYGNGEHFIHMDIVNTLGFSINSVTVNGDDWSGASDEFHTNDDNYHIEINVSKNSVTGDKVPRIQYGGNWNGYITASTNQNGNNYTFVLDVTNSEHQEFLGLEILENNNQGGQEPGEPHFDGKAYVVWSCGNGTCYHYFDNIPNFDDGKSTFYKDTDVTADNNNSIKFDVKASHKDWILKEGFDRWVNAYKEKYNVQEIDWSQVNPESIIGSPPDMREWEDQAVSAGVCTRENTPEDEFHSCVDGYMAAHSDALPFVKLQPVGEPEDNNAYVSYGDRNFKVVIYNSDFKGITMGSLDDLNYYPASWNNPFIMRDQFDISGTSKNKSTGIDTILLEDTVVIKALNYNSFAISKIEALDVPENAVTITKVNDEFKLKFSSNFYDNVVFKVTDNNGGISYFNVKRYTVDAWINNVENKPHLYAELYFDKNKSYSDFDLTAKIEYKDGTIKNVALTAYNKIDDGLGNITEAYEVDESVSPDPEHMPAGKGLKKSVFIYKLPNGKTDRDVKKAYINVEYKGSTSSNYAGAFAGSGKGVLANIYQGDGE